MRETRRFNEEWSFSGGFRQRATRELVAGEIVKLPHSAVELPLNYFDEAAYQREFCYQKTFKWEPALQGRSVRLLLDGAMADSAIYLNGAKVSEHFDGYTPVRAELSDRLQRGSNLLTVRISGRENPAIPPFGGQIDYLTYAGIYRDAWLIISGKTWIESLKVETPEPLRKKKSVAASYRLGGNAPEAGTLDCKIFDLRGNAVASQQRKVVNAAGTFEFDGLRGLSLWDINSPSLYRLELTLTCRNGGDRLAADFGFRSAEFREDGFFLNGRPVKLIGLNRHQSFPYVGYAMGRRAQERDAEILKRELSCNLVRTSHYPQSPWFLDHCDRIGLLVFEEMPGWQHIGGDIWRRRALDTIANMIRRDWNHPSIVLWGVRINESPDSSEFYRQANAVARSMDSTRQTAGVRNFEGSEFLEDVYTMNDFIMGSGRTEPSRNRPAALRSRQDATRLVQKVPYLITEFGGHMYPTKTWDGEERQIQHVSLFLEVLDAMYGDPEISGCIGWCMADYNTHSDFGSGDRICHHGVLDMFRLPKFAADVYSSQAPPSYRPVLRPITYWARGERSVGGVLPLLILTNCDLVEMQFGDGPPSKLFPDGDRYPHLPYPPVILEASGIPDGSLGGWGSEWHSVLFRGLVGGKPVAEVSLPANPTATELRLSADSTTLFAGEKDAVRIVARALDQCGNLMPFFTDPLSVSASGPARLLGPDLLALRRGVCSLLG